MSEVRMGYNNPSKAFEIYKPVKGYETVQIELDYRKFYPDIELSPEFFEKNSEKLQKIADSHFPLLGVLFHYDDKQFYVFYHAGEAAYYAPSHILLPPEYLIWDLIRLRYFDFHSEDTSEFDLSIKDVLVTQDYNTLFRSSTFASREVELPKIEIQQPFAFQSIPEVFPRNIPENYPMNSLFSITQKGSDGEAALWNSKWNQFFTLSKNQFRNSIFYHITNIIKPHRPKDYFLNAGAEDYRYILDNYSHPTQHLAYIDNKLVFAVYSKFEKRFIPIHQVYDWNYIITKEYLDNHSEKFVYSDYYDKFILKKYAVFSNAYNSYIPGENAVYSDREEDYYDDGDSRVFWSDYYDDYITEYVGEVVWLDAIQSYVYAEDEVVSDYYYDDDKLIAAYHKGRQSVLYGEDDGSGIKLGFELELHLQKEIDKYDVAEYLSEHFDFIKLENDGSLLNGFEVISDIFNPSFLDSKELKDFMDYISTVNSTRYKDAGLHIHFSFEEYDDKPDAEAEYQLVRAVNMTWDLFQHIYRRKPNTYCYLEEIDRWPALFNKKVRLSKDRHMAINISDPEYSGFELRLFKTAKTYEQLRQAFDLVLALIDYIRQGYHNKEFYYKPFARFVKENYAFLLK